PVAPYKTMSNSRGVAVTAPDATRRKSGTSGAATPGDKKMPGTRPGTPYLCDGEAVGCGRGSAATSADRPSADALRVQHVLGHPDLLLTARAGRGTRPAVTVPRARRELQATGEAVTGTDRPVSTRLALRDGIPVHAVGLHRRRRGVRGRRRRHVRVKTHRRRSWRGVRRRSWRGVRSRRRVWSGPGGCHVRVKTHRLRVGAGRWDGHERAGDSGQNERLTDVLQYWFLSRCVRQSKPTGVG